jgi:Tfp pilus assembly protein PilV
VARIVEALWRARPSARRYGGSSSPSVSGPFGLRTSDAGFTLLDVVVAITVLMVVLLPIAYLLSTTSKVGASNQNRLTAQSVAASWLDQERALAQQSSSSPPSNISGPVGSVSSPQWPSTPVTETVGTITYQIYVAGGWCAYSGAGNAWTNGTVTTTTTGSSTPLSFFVAVKVAWGPDAAQPNPSSTGQNDGMVVEYSSLPTGAGWQVQEASGGVSVLTVTNTTLITGNICPLSLTGVA